MSVSPPSFFASLLLGAALASSASARAEQRATDTLWLSLPSCDSPPYQEAELRHALQVELGPRGLRAELLRSGSVRGPRVMLSLSSCAPDAESLTLQMSTARGQALEDRTLLLRAIAPAARARTLALLIADALEPPRLPGSAEPSQPEDSEPAALAARSSPPAPPDAPLRPRLAPASEPMFDEGLLERDDPYPSPPRLQFGLGLQTRLLMRQNDQLYGIELSLGGHLFGRSEWILEGAYSQGVSFTEERKFDLDWFNAAGGVDLIVVQQPRLSVGPRVGVSRVIGLSDSEQRAMTVSLGGRVEVSAPISKYASLQVAVDGSSTAYVRPFTEDGEFLPLYGMHLTWGIGATFAL